ncbi:MAG: protein kinase [Kofleriaceae bacterium]
MEALRERFGKYHVLDKIAQGGMAEVYKVKTVGIAGFEKIQALKRILPGSAREGRFIRSFIDEARIAVELTHRNIVQVFDFGKADGELFLAMELIEGKDLRTALGHGTARELPPSGAVSAYIISEVAQGLDYAHRKTDVYGGSLGIVHCDVSPSNVMLSMDGYVKILDFGIARATFASALERRRLRGKPRYMAPEQTLGEPPTAAADVFALGIIAWELFTGLPLYRGPDLKSILDSVRRTKPPRIDTIVSSLPAEIVNGVATALNREPTQRGTAADLAAACARLAMSSGARQLADWLAELDRRPSTTQISWPREVTSISVPAPVPEPPPRPSVTAALANVPPALMDFGEGTPGFSHVPIRPSDAWSDAPSRPSTTAIERLPFDEREVSTATRPGRLDAALIAQHPRYASEPGSKPEPTVSVTAPRYPSEPTASTVAAWKHDPTVSGAPRLADALSGAPVAFQQAPATEPFERPSYASIQLGPGAAPSSLRFDDEATQHGFSLPMPVAPDDTSYDELEVESDAPHAPQALDEPIDDELGALAERAPVVTGRRRTVVVAGVVGGATHEVLRGVTRSLGELAYQRGGVVIALDDEAVVLAFGLEVAGEDDVAIAMGWALDAGAMARDAVPDATITFRVGARTGVATVATSGASPDAAIPQDVIDDVRTLAREAPVDRPLFVGGAGRMTSSLYALREVPAPRRSGRPRRAIEVVGTRGFDERDRARLERRGKFVGRTAQLGELETWLDRAIVTHRRLAVMIQGAAGTGKSRLVAELIARRQAAGTPLRIVTTAASPASRLAPFALVIDLYQAALGLPPARGRSARAQVVQRLLHLMGKGGVSAPRARRRDGSRSRDGATRRHGRRCARGRRLAAADLGGTRRVSRRDLGSRARPAHRDRGRPPRRQREPRGASAHARGAGRRRRAARADRPPRGTGPRDRRHDPGRRSGRRGAPRPDRGSIAGRRVADQHRGRAGTRWWQPAVHRGARRRGARRGSASGGASVRARGHLGATRTAVGARTGGAAVRVGARRQRARAAARGVARGGHARAGARRAGAGGLPGAGRACGRLRGRARVRARPRSRGRLRVAVGAHAARLPCARRSAARVPILRRPRRAAVRDRGAPRARWRARGRCRVLVAGRPARADRLGLRRRRQLLQQDDRARSRAR